MSKLKWTRIYPYSLFNLLMLSDHKDLEAKKKQFMLLHLKMKDSCQILMMMEIFKALLYFSTMYKQI